jgi:ferredoxin-thioredoxin reductase catalytic subunit
MTMDNEILNKQEIEIQIKVLEEWVNRQEKDKFVLNPDKQIVERLMRGVLNNEKNYGLKFCPCRMTTEDLEQDKKLVCPCNFKIQKTWKEKSECWCSLFVKVKVDKSID